MRVDDAKRAVDLGADAIIVSNHGGRQLDSTPSTISVLPEIARAVGDQIEVFWDGGLRSGFDIVKALGRGAKGTLSGRAWVYGLAAMGQKGVAKALDIIHGELKDCMSLGGFTDVHHLPEGFVTAQPAL